MKQGLQPMSNTLLTVLLLLHWQHDSGPCRDCATDLHRTPFTAHVCSEPLHINSDHNSSVARSVCNSHDLMQVIEESKHQLRTAERHLHALRTAYPEVMASIRTKQVAQEMLLVKEAYVHELKASGNHVLQQLSLSLAF